MMKSKEITTRQALKELWGSIVDLMPFPCEPDWTDSSTIKVNPTPPRYPPMARPGRQPIVVRFGERGIGVYQYCNDGMRRRAREDVAYVVTVMLRAYNLGLHTSRDDHAPFVIDCELLLYPEHSVHVAIPARGH